MAASTPTPWSTCEPALTVREQPMHSRPTVQLLLAAATLSAAATVSTATHGRRCHHRRDAFPRCGLHCRRHRLRDHHPGLQQRRRHRHPAPAEVHRFPPGRLRRRCADTRRPRVLGGDDPSVHRLRPDVGTVQSDHVPHTRRPRLPHARGARLLRIFWLAGVLILFEAGAWHVISLNSEIDHSLGSTQEQWLKADLAASSATCVAAFWGEPRWTSGPRSWPTHPST